MSAVPQHLPSSLSGPSLPARRVRRRLLERWHLITLALVLSGALIALLPTPQTLRPGQAGYDALALEYLRLLAEFHPDDPGLRLLLAERLWQRGRLREAQAALAPLLSPVARRPASSGARLLALRLQLAASGASLGSVAPRGAGGASTAVLRQEASALVQRSATLSSAELIQLADLCRALNQNELAARVYQQLAERDPAAHRAWLRRAAEALLAAARPGEAALIFDQLALDLAAPPAAQEVVARDQRRRPRRPPGLLRGRRLRHGRDAHRRSAVAEAPVSGREGRSGAVVDDDPKKDALRALQAYQWAGQGAQALQRARVFVERFPADQPLLRAALALALAQGDLALARRFGQRLLTLAPGDGAVRARLIQAALAAGQLDEALALAAQAVEREPAAAAAHLQLARVGEWTGHPEVALREYAWLARREPAGEALRAALRLAPQLREFALEGELLAQKARWAPLTSIELQTLAQRFEDSGEPEQGCAVLAAYLARWPAEREAYLLLARLQARSGDLGGALVTRADLLARLGEAAADPDALVEAAARARLLWRLHLPALGLALLAAAFEARALRQKQGRAAGAALRARLLQAEPGPGADHDAERPLELLRQLLAAVHSDEPLLLRWHQHLLEAQLLDAAEVERYAELLRAVGRTREVAAVAEAASRYLPDPLLLRAALELVHAGGHHPEAQALLRLLVRWEQDPRIGARADYWLLKADVLARGQERAARRAAYAQVLRLEPDNEVAQVGLLELLVQDAERAQSGEDDDEEDAEQGAASARPGAQPGAAQRGAARAALRAHLQRFRAQLLRGAPADTLLFAHELVGEQAPPALARPAPRRAPDLEGQGPAADALAGAAEPLRAGLSASRLRPLRATAEYQIDVQGPLLLQRASVTLERQRSRLWLRAQLAVTGLHALRLTTEAAEAAETAPGQASAPESPLTLVVPVAGGTSTFSWLSTLELAAAIAVGLRHARGWLSAGAALHALRPQVRCSGCAAAPTALVDLPLGYTTLPGLWLAEEATPLRGLRVKGQLTLNEIISDSPLLRYAGARDSISADVDWDLSARELLRAQGALWRLHEREVFGAAGTIAWGGGAEAQLGHRLRLRRPALSLLATGSFAQNRLSTGFVPAIIRGALGEPSAPAGVDPPNLARLFVGERFAQVGASAAVQHDPERRGLRYHAELWLGWLLASDPAGADSQSFGFALRAGLGLALSRGRELAAQLYASNNQRVVQWQGQLYLGGGLRYQH